MHYTPSIPPQKVAPVSSHSIVWELFVHILCSGLYEQSSVTNRASHLLACHCDSLLHETMDATHNAITALHAYLQIIVGSSIQVTTRQTFSKSLLYDSWQRFSAMLSGMVMRVPAGCIEAARRRRLRR